MSNVHESGKERYEMLMRTLGRIEVKINKLLGKNGVRSG